MNVVSIQAKISWKAFRDPETCYWGGVCDGLNFTAQGETWAKLLESISETLDLMFQELSSTGEMDQFLKERGWKQEGDLTLKLSARTHFDVPFKGEPQKRRYDPAPSFC